MTVTEFLDSKLEKDTHDIVLLDLNGNILKVSDFDNLHIQEISYRKIAYIKIK